METEKQFDGIVGRSVPMRAMTNTILKVAPHNFTVLIRGESGTGKELVARSILSNSKRLKGPFLPVNCGAIPDGLLEAHLFGHQKGAFTGASSDKPGIFEAANGGTIFLDEIGEMPLAMQVKLLRALQEKEVVRVGATKSTKIDVRLIAATNASLCNMSKAKLSPAASSVGRLRSKKSWR
ncbi:MAG: sigma-54 factor interaction domain-containing protein [Acidobacteriota bacterium]